MIKAVIWLAVFFTVGLPLFYGPANTFMESILAAHRFSGAGLIFMTAGLLGETLKGRTAGRPPLKPGRAALLGLMWGGAGLAAGLMFPLINLGVAAAQAIGLLPFGGYSPARHPAAAILTSFFFAGPFFTSLILNVMAAPIWLIRKLTLLSFPPENPGRWTLNGAAAGLDWTAFLRSEAIQTLLLRLPFLTVVIMLPEPYWIYLTAWLLMIFIMLEDLTTARPRLSRAAPSAK